MSFTIGTDISYEELDHQPEQFPAYYPDYDINDIGKNIELTVTLFGYQLDTEAIKKLVEALNQHIRANDIHEYEQYRNNLSNIPLI